MASNLEEIQEAELIEECRRCFTGLLALTHELRNDEVIEMEAIEGNHSPPRESQRNTQYGLLRNDEMIEMEATQGNHSPPRESQRNTQYGLQQLNLRGLFRRCNERMEKHLKNVIIAVLITVIFFLVAYAEYNGNKQDLPKNCEPCDGKAMNIESRYGNIRDVLLGVTNGTIRFETLTSAFKEAPENFTLGSDSLFSNRASPDEAMDSVTATSQEAPENFTLGSDSLFSNRASPDEAMDSVTATSQEAPENFTLDSDSLFSNRASPDEAMDSATATSQAAKFRGQMAERLNKTVEHSMHQKEKALSTSRKATELLLPRM